MFKNSYLKMVANCKGITLLEIILTISLLTCGTVPIAICIYRGLMIDHIIEGQSVALTLAQQAMEQVENASSFSAVSTLASAKAALASPYASYSREILESGTNPITVTVNVYYGQGFKVSLVTYITNVATYPGT